MSRFHKVLLKDITKKIGSGATPTGGQNSYQKEGISLIRSQNVHDFQFSMSGLAYINEDQAKALNNVIVEENDILLNITGDSIARVCIVPKKILPARVNQHVSIIRCKNDISSPYIFYYLENLKPYLLKICGVGGTRNALTKEAVEKLEILIPDFSTQQKIASILASLDSKIELNNRINAELEAMAKTLYDYWFVQFDFPDKNGKPYKTSGGKMVWNDELKREIPEGWKVKKMVEVLVIKNGRDHKHLELGSIPVYGSGGIMRYANESIYDSESILIPRKGTLGNLFYINMPFWCVDTIFYTIMKFSGSCKYLFYTIRAFNISSMNTGTAVPSMTTEILNNLALVFPPFETLKTFDSIVSPIFQKKEYIVKENQKLSELRDWLLPMLMNGQVTVGETTNIGLKKVERNIYSINMQKLLRMASELHKRGYEKLRVVPSLSPSGMSWRCSFVADPENGIVTSTWLSEYSHNEREIEYSINELAELFEREHMRFLELCKGKNKDYVEWYQNMLSHLEEDELPYAFAEYFSPTDYWKTTNDQKIETLPNEKNFYYGY